jgi:hypothetical protein
MLQALTIKLHRSPEIRFSEINKSVKNYPSVKRLPVVKRLNPATRNSVDNIPLHEWKMPVQPSGYIKSPGFDFL